MSDTLQNLKEYITKMNQYEHVVTLLNWDMACTGYDIFFNRNVQAFHSKRTGRYAGRVIQTGRV